MIFEYGHRFDKWLDRVYGRVYGLTRRFFIFLRRRFLRHVWIWAVLSIGLLTLISGVKHFYNSFYWQWDDGGVYWLNDSWTAQEEAVWYETSQGSHLIPYDWFKALKNKEGEPFASRENLAQYGYDFMREDDVLPIGFVVDKGRANREFLGPNCSACHTGRLTINGKDYFVHGGSTMGNFRDFIFDLTEAVRDASNDRDFIAAQAKNSWLGRHIKLNDQEKTAKDDNGDDNGKEKIVKRDYLELCYYKPRWDDTESPSQSCEAIAKVQKELASWLAHRDRMASAINEAEAKGQIWGHGRLDAVAMISNKLSVELNPGSNHKLAPTNGPVGYPPIWNVNQQALLQHNGLVTNGPDFGFASPVRIGSFLRNYTQVYGVFGEAQMNSKGQQIYNSINIGGLMRLEQVAAKLQSPRLPKEYYADLKSIEAGREIYEAACIGCHVDLPLDADSGEYDLKKQLVARPNIELLRKRQQVKCDAGQLDEAECLAYENQFIYMQPVFDVKRLRAQYPNFNIVKWDKPVGTDPMMACNALMHESPSGVFAYSEMKSNQRSTFNWSYHEPMQKAGNERTRHLTAKFVLDDVFGVRAASLFENYVHNQFTLSGEQKLTDIYKNFLELKNRKVEIKYSNYTPDPRTVEQMFLSGGAQIARIALGQSGAKKPLSEYEQLIDDCAAYTGNFLSNVIVFPQDDSPYDMPSAHQVNAKLNGEEVEAIKYVPVVANTKKVIYRDVENWEILPDADGKATDQLMVTNFPSYKARPLNGIWATAPFLHNNSVPSLYDLLLPHEDRPSGFWFGGPDYDLDKLGIARSDEARDDASYFSVYNDAGEVIPGNYNGGHEYFPRACEIDSGSAACEKARIDLINYIKTL